MIHRSRGVRLGSIREPVFCAGGRLDARQRNRIAAVSPSGAVPWMLLQEIELAPGEATVPLMGR